MQDDNSKIPAVYLPSNEPYLGRQSVYQFDNVIIACLEANSRVAAYTHKNQLSDLQKAACQIIPQGINLALTIRELVRQGYLFGALVLMRSLIERAGIISYLHKHPDAIEIWKGGWNYKGKDTRPTFKKMLEVMSDSLPDAAKQLALVADTYNHIVHGDPIGSGWNLIRLTDTSLGYSVSKVINEPDLCDFICFQSLCYLIVLHGRMIETFPDALSSE